MDRVVSCLQIKKNSQDISFLFSPAEYHGVTLYFGCNENAGNQGVSGQGRYFQLGDFLFG